MADRLFLETVVRIYRAGEGAPYTGLKRRLEHGSALALPERDHERVAGIAAT